MFALFSDLLFSIVPLVLSILLPCVRLSFMEFYFFSEFRECCQEKNENINIVYYIRILIFCRCFGILPSAKSNSAASCLLFLGEERERRGLVPPRRGRLVQARPEHAGPRRHLGVIDE